MRKTKAEGKKKLEWSEDSDEYSESVSEDASEEEDRYNVSKVLSTVAKEVSTVSLSKCN